MSSYAIDREKWSKLTLFEQLGNIGSEVGRAISAQKRHDIANQNSAIDRALDLFAATAETQPYPRTKEILRARDEFLALFFGDSHDSSAIERYFTTFALAARLSR